MKRISIFALVVLALNLRQPCRADTVATIPPKSLVDLAAPEVEKRFVPSGAQVTVARGADPAAPGVDVSIAPGPAGYPGVNLKPVGDTPWDLTGFGHVEATATNTGIAPLSLSLRIDNPGDWTANLWNAEHIYLRPGKTGTIKVYFGYSWGQPSYRFKPNALSSVTIFTGKTAVNPASFRLLSLVAAGVPGEVAPIDPNSVRTTPVNGVVFGPAIAVNAAKQLVAQGGATARFGNQVLDLSFAGPNQAVTLKPEMGVWNLNGALEVKVDLKNTGALAVAPSVRLDSRGGSSNPIAAAAPIAPGARGQVVVPFAASTPWVGIVDPAQDTLEGKKSWGGEPNTGTNYSSSVANGITILSDAAAGAQSLEVTSIVADVPPAPALPAWLGDKPPVPGDWTQTFDDEFDGNAIDLHKWNIYTAGTFHLGAQDHYSKDNVIVKAGKLTLRIEKKRGHHNDDPAQVENDYATGYADTFGKWTQRYGYFEARVKYPTAPSSFLSFWMMPDRGLAAGDDNLRHSTKKGGMEFDIMETLSIWGPYRHDFGMHWDDYVKYHKSNGAFNLYAPTDKDGFVTVGMLWTPGHVAMYDNGQEVASWDSPRISSVPEYFILDNITGGWESEPLDDSKLPADFVIDYVRAWQRKDLASDADGPKQNDGGPLPPVIAPPVGPASAR